MMTGERQWKKKEETEDGLLGTSTKVWAIILLFWLFCSNESTNYSVWLQENMKPRDTVNKKKCKKLFLGYMINRNKPKSQHVLNKCNLNKYALNVSEWSTALCSFTRKLLMIQRFQRQSISSRRNWRSTRSPICKCSEFSSLLYRKFGNLTCTNHLHKAVMRNAYKPAVVNKREALRTPCGFLSK